MSGEVYCEYGCIYLLNMQINVRRFLCDETVHAPELILSRH
jgi:hypothetical protein